MFSFAFVLGSSMLFGNPSVCASSAKRINLKSSLNKLQREESHGTSDGGKVCMCVCVCVCVCVCLCARA